MKSKSFYFQLAKTNIKRNRRVYLPFLLSCMVVVAFFFNLLNLEQILEHSNNVYGNRTVAALLAMGGIVVAALAIVFIFYANSFLMKNRKKELGLYGILGMEKVHISRVLLLETFIIGLTSIICGLLLGMAFGNLVFLIMAKLTRYSVNMSFMIYLEPLVITTIFFLGVFLVVLAVNLISIHVSEPIALLKSKKQGEKQPRFLVLWAILGLACIGTGYYIALAVEEPLKALQLFLLAVLLVIAGTHYLFASTSIVFLKLLKGSKTFYYKPSNFISTSSLIYRMRKNAVGLANICILSCMVIATVSTTATVYGGMGYTADRRFPREYTMSWAMRQGLDILGGVEKDLKAHADQTGVEILDYYSIRQVQFMTLVVEGELIPFRQLDTDIFDQNTMERAVYVTVLPESDFENLSGLDLDLGQGEILISPYLDIKAQDSFRLLGKDYKVKGVLSRQVSDKVFNPDMIDLIGQLVVVVGDQVDIWDFGVEGGPNQKIFFNIKANPDQVAAFKNFTYSFQDEDRKIEMNLRSKQAFLEEFYGFAGGLYFVGIFLGALFLILTVLIIYFKQISEGEEDRDRFTILMKVGLSSQEAKKAIHKQLIMMFFLPLVTAVIHVSVAKHIVARLLLIGFGGDHGLLGPYMWTSIGIFTVIYFVVYLWTSRTYYRIVGSGNVGI